MLKIYDLKTEYRTNPLGIDASRPRFSWKIKGDERDILQTAYRIIAKDRDDLLWDSGMVESADSQRVRYAGPEVLSGQRVNWKVAVYCGSESAESEYAWFEMALLSRSDWKAKWIQPERIVDFDSFKPAIRLRKEFFVKPGIVRARIYQSSHGLYSFKINGRSCTEDKFNPGITSYYQRVQYQTYDITDALREGNNTWSVILADGWWRGYTGGGNRNNFGFYLSFIGQIIVDYEDGSRDTIVSDENFKTSPSAILRCDMKVGEVYDARLVDEGWELSGYDDSSWKNVISASEYPSVDVLIPSRSVPVKEKENFEGKPFTDKAGNTVLDFGQNHAGYVRMILKNTKPGQKVILWHGEDLKDGVFSTANLEDTSDDPFQQIVYICKGANKEEYCPNFAVFGFRYVKLEGYDADLIESGDFTSIAVYSDLEETGDFKCSNPLINQLVRNSRWSQKSNFLDAATDCPTRERSTWSGDSQVYCKTAADFMNVYPFFEKWLIDMNLEQFESGCIGNTFPATNSLHNPEELRRMTEQGRFVFAPPTLCGPEGDGDFMEGAAGWGDVATIAPYTMYLCYGDKAILKQQYETAKRWVNFCRKNAREHNPLYENEPQYQNSVSGIPDADYIYDTHFHWGEWLEPDAAENGGSQTFNPMEFKRLGNPLVATAYLYYSCTLIAKMAGILAEFADAADFSKYAANVKRVYNKYFIEPDGTILKGRQAPYVRTLAFGLASEENIPKVARKLAEEVKKADFTVNTGFLSTPYILGQLVKYGYVDYAFRLLEQTAFPSWLHPVTLGATTILENWGGLDDYQASFNHYSYGAVCDFLFSVVAGISPDPDSPGYKHFFIEPVIGGTLTGAAARYESVYGTIYSEWNLEGEKATYKFTIPANTAATVILPADRINAADVISKYGAETDGGKICFKLGSGEYSI